MPGARWSASSWRSAVLAGVALPRAPRAAASPARAVAARSRSSPSSTGTRRSALTPLDRPARLRGARRRSARRGLRGAVRHRRRPEHRRRFAGAARALLRDAARASAGRRLHRPHAGRCGGRATSGCRSSASLLRLSDGRPDIAAAAGDDSACGYLVVNRAQHRSALREYVRRLPLSRSLAIRPAIYTASDARPPLTWHRPDRQTRVAIRTAVCQLQSRPYDDGPESPQMRELRGAEARRSCPGVWESLRCAAPTMRRRG